MIAEFSYVSSCEQTLEQQANEMGLTLGAKAEKFETLRRELNHIHLYISSERQHDLMLKKLHQIVTKNLRALNPAVMISVYTKEDLRYRRR